MSIAGKTVLVTGATGFLGSYLVNRLATEGAQVRALARRAGRDRYIVPASNVEIVMGNLLEPDSLRNHTRGCDVVFHVGAALGGSLVHQRAVNVEGTRNLVNAAAEASVRRVVHISTIAVYGYKHQGDLREDMPPQPGNDPYQISKAEGEAVVRELGARHGIEYAIMRPGMIYGPRANTWTRRLFKLARRKPTLAPGDGSGSSFPIHVDDVVDLCLVLATHPNAVNQIFNCAPDPAPTWREWLGEYSALVGHRRWLGIPIPLLLPLAYVVRALVSTDNQLKDLPDMLRFISTRRVYRMDRARELLGWEPKISLSDGVRSCVPYLREKGLL